MSKTKKRERAENWSREERDILLEIIKNYRHILDNQANNANTNKLKNIVWNHINNRFHELSNSTRDVNQLKSFWKRLKTAARKKARSQMNGSAASDNEKLSHCDDSSVDEATNNVSTYDNDDSMFGQTCNPSEVVLLVEPNRDSNSKGDNQNLDEGVEEDDEDLHSGSVTNDLATMKYENSIDFDSSQNSRLQNNHGLKKKHKTRSMKSSLGTQDDKSEDNYLYKEFLLKRFYLRLYHKNQIKHQHKKHKLEIENLLLERKKIELEIELSKKKLELLDK